MDKRAGRIEQASKETSQLPPSRFSQLIAIRQHLQQERALGSKRFQAMAEKTLGRYVSLRRPGGRGVWIPRQRAFNFLRPGFLISARFRSASAQSDPSSSSRHSMKAPIPDITRDLFDLSGYCSIVSGASAGIGLTTAEALARRGSDLLLVGRNAEHLERAAGKVRETARRVATVAVNVANNSAPQRIVEAALELNGRIDVLVNNAGFMTFSNPLDVNDDTWEEISNVNVRAPMHIKRALLPVMINAAQGSIINIGSSWSSRAPVFNQDGGGVDYCSSKAALQARTRATEQDVAATTFA